VKNEIDLFSIYFMKFTIIKHIFDIGVIEKILKKMPRMLSQHDRMDNISFVGLDSQNLRHGMRFDILNK
jgi:hypothetical protein